MLQMIFNEGTFSMGFDLATPILLCALGGAVCNNAGNFNIALEGFMLIASFFGVVGAFFLKSTLVGILFAIASGFLIAVIYGLFRSRFKAHEIILGFGFNMFSIAFTGWMLVPILGGRGSFYNPATPSLSKISIPLIRSIPFIRILSNHNIIVYLSWLLIPLLYILIYRMPFGFKIRALGQEPEILRVNGLNPNKYFYFSEAIAGILCGLAGAFLSIGNLSMFTENMTAGRGFIAVAAIVFANGYIPTVGLISIVFGIASAIAIQLQGLGMPTELIDMTPYVLTIIMLVLTLLKKKPGQLTN